MTSITPSQNALQRRYFAWARPYYERMPEPLRSEVECLDRWLCSRAGGRFWLIVIGAAVLGAVALRAVGLPWLGALLGSLCTGASVLVVALGAWLAPARYTPAFVLRFAIPGMVVGCLCMFGLDAIGLAMGPDGVVASDLVALGHRMATKALPAMLVVLVLMTVLISVVAAVRRFRLRREVAALRVAQERETAARQLAEARLELLQAQIQPHFIFNTLAAVQHWVDVGDARAGPLLRALTSFLRGSTELLAQAEAPLAVELDTVAHYLAIMEARLGDRVRHVIDVDAATAARRLPPGVLLTLVENAVEHGLAPMIHGGTLRVRVSEDADGWTIAVSDDGIGLPPDWREGVGLRNCRERLAHRFGGAASLSLEPLATGTVATVRIAAAP